MADRVALGGGELRLVARVLSLLLGEQPIMLGQRCLPALLQRARDQPVLRLDRVVLALRSRDLVGSLLEPQGALPAPTGAVDLDLLGQRQAYLDGGRRSASSSSCSTTVSIARPATDWQ